MLTAPGRDSGQDSETEGTVRGRGWVGRLGGPEPLPTHSPSAGRKAGGSGGEATRVPGRQSTPSGAPPPPQGSPGGRTRADGRTRITERPRGGQPPWKATCPICIRHHEKETSTWAVLRADLSEILGAMFLPRHRLICADYIYMSVYVCL